MRSFSNLDELVAAGEAGRWRRLVEAIRRADRVLPDVTYSIGDSLTYRVTTRPDCVEFTGHRRYVEARCVLDGVTEIEVAAEAALRPTDASCDLTDRQHFAGAGERHRLGAGRVVVIDPGEAVRDVFVDGRVMVLRASVTIR